MVRVLSRTKLGENSIVLLEAVALVILIVKLLMFPETPLPSRNRPFCCIPVFVIVTFKSPVIVPSWSKGLLEVAPLTVIVLPPPAKVPVIFKARHSKFVFNVTVVLPPTTHMSLVPGKSTPAVPGEVLPYVPPSLIFPSVVYVKVAIYLSLSK